MVSTVDGRLGARILRSAVAMLAITLFGFIAATHPAFAQTETILYSFCSAANCTDGAGPDGGSIADSAGNLYGLTGRCPSIIYCRSKAACMA